MATQLRDYRIRAGQLDDWVREWGAGIAPIRRGLGFTIDGAWAAGDESRFVWLLSHPGDWTEFEAADRAYHDSPDRKRLDPDPARLIEEQRTLRLEELPLP